MSKETQPADKGRRLSGQLGPVACATCGEAPYYTRAHIVAAVAAERERCAKVCEAAWEIDGQATADEFAARVRGA